jgi:hypothetical protein
VVAAVSGVHSRRAKRLLVTRMAERRGITTLAPLLQIVVPGLRGVDVRVRLGEAREAAALSLGSSDDVELTGRLREEAAALARDRR